MPDHGGIDGAPGRVGGRGGTQTDDCRGTEEVTAVHGRVGRRVLRKPDVSGRDPEPFGYQREDIHVPGGLAAALQAADGALAVPAHVSELLLGPSALTPGGCDGLAGGVVVRWVRHIPVLGCGSEGR